MSGSIANCIFLSFHHENLEYWRRLTLIARTGNIGGSRHKHPIVGSEEYELKNYGNPKDSNKKLQAKNGSMRL